jgi:hypothetical protein
VDRAPGRSSAGIPPSSSPICVNDTTSAWDRSGQMRKWVFESGRVARVERYYSGVERVAERTTYNYDAYGRLEMRRGITSVYLDSSRAAFREGTSSSVGIAEGIVDLQRHPDKKSLVTYGILALGGNTYYGMKLMRHRRLPAIR